MMIFYSAITKSRAFKVRGKIFTSFADALLACEASA